MTRFFRKQDGQAAREYTDTEIRDFISDPQGVEAATERLGAAAVALVDAARDALQVEDEAFRAFGRDEVGWWFRDFDAKKRAMIDFAATHRRELEDAASLVAGNRGDLVDLAAVREFARLFREADAARNDAPKRRRPPQIHAVLPLLRLPAEAEALVGQVIGPERPHSGLMERALSDWRFDLRDLPEACFVPTGHGARGMIFEHPVIAARLEADQPQEATA